MGRWLNRDQAGKIGGLNPYAFVSSYTVGSVDVCGLFEFPVIDLYPPATPDKCEKLRRVMALNSMLAGRVSRWLWLRWLENRGGNEVLSMESFDPLGTCRREANDAAIKSLEGNIDELMKDAPCDSTRQFDTQTLQPRTCISLNMMIYHYTLRSSYNGYATKRCNGCCTKFAGALNINHESADRTDFNDNGPGFNALPFYEINDKLVNQCFHAWQQRF